MRIKLLNIIIDLYEIYANFIDLLPVLSKHRGLN
jgi:hypothetical protein